VTQVFLMPWRPEPDREATVALRAWRANDGHAYPGVAFNVTFDLGPLALALTERPPTTGADADAGLVFWNTAATTSRALFADAGWSPHRLAVRVNGSAYGRLAETAATLRALR